MHPLYLTVIRRPDLIVDHLGAYAALLTQEASQASQALANRALLWIVVVFSGAIGVVLSGTALMLGVLQNQFHWILVAVPGVMVFCALVALAQAKQAVFASHFANIKSQLFSDAQALRVVAGHEAQSGPI
jgi:cytochrome bd-type quinol oxidase subunit 2